MSWAYTQHTVMSLRESATDGKQSAATFISRAEKHKRKRLDWHRLVFFSVWEKENSLLSLAYGLSQSPRPAAWG